MANQVIDCLGVVLAGGLSSRMGQDKAQLKRHNHVSASPEQSAQTMLDFSKKLLVDAGIPNIVISGDNHQIPDRIAHAGPVGGIYSVLSHYHELQQPKALLILPVDLPLMTASALTELRLKGELSHKATFYTDGQQNKHHIPLYLPNNAFLNMFLMQAFHQGQLVDDSDSKNMKNNKKGPSVRALLENIPHQAIANNNHQTLFNTNTPEQWKQAQQQF